MAKKEFDNLTGKLEPDYPRPKVPKELKKVEQPVSPSDPKFKFRDYMRFAWKLLLAKGESLLTNQRKAGEKFLSWTTVIAIGIGILIIVIVSLLQ